ncbi:MAG: OmpA family protein, partial [Pseudomonadota bacterium]
MSAIVNGQRGTGAAALSAIALLATATTALAQQPSASQSAPQPVDAYTESATKDSLVVTGTPPADLSGFPEGPDLEGFISARAGNKVEVTQADGSSAMVAIGEGTKIKASGGFLGLSREKLGMAQLLNGVPVKIETVEWGGSLVASEVKLKSSDLKTAQMIQSGTQQKFAQQGARIGENTEATARNAAATEALRGRFGDIDKYNLKSTTNVYFDTGKYALSSDARFQLCEAARQAEA